MDRYSKQEPQAPPGEPTNKKITMMVCPTCNKPLLPGDKVKSLFDYNGVTLHQTCEMNTRTGTINDYGTVHWDGKTYRAG